MILVSSNQPISIRPKKYDWSSLLKYWADAWGYHTPPPASIAYVLFWALAYWIRPIFGSCVLRTFYFEPLRIEYVLFSGPAYCVRNAFLHQNWLAYRVSKGGVVVSFKSVINVFRQVSVFWSEDPPVRRPVSPRVHQSKSSWVRRAASP